MLSARWFMLLNSGYLPLLGDGNQTIDVRIYATILLVDDHHHGARTWGTWCVHCRTTGVLVHGFSTETGSHPFSCSQLQSTRDLDFLTVTHLTSLTQQRTQPGQLVHGNSACQAAVADRNKLPAIGPETYWTTRRSFFQSSVREPAGAGDMDTQQPCIHGYIQIWM